MLSPAVAGALPRVYVPNLRSNDVYVIDPATRKVVDRFPVGFLPQHVVPAWDLQTLWVANNGRRRSDGSLTPIDPKTGRPGASVPVADPYNMYFTPDGKSAIVVAERLKRLDFRDPHTMALQQSVPTPGCSGVNHADFSIDGRYAIFTCEFRGGGLVKVDMVNRKVLGYLKLDARGMPQDIRISPDGKVFFVADMLADGVFVVDGDSFHQGGLHPDRDRHARPLPEPRRHQALRRRTAARTRSTARRTGRAASASSTLPPARSRRPGRSPAAAAPTWAMSAPTANSCGCPAATTTSSTTSTPTTGAVTKIPVGIEPHGLTVWPQPGRYSLGHTGNMR